MLLPQLEPKTATPGPLQGSPGQALPGEPKLLPTIDSRSMRSVMFAPFENFERLGQVHRIETRGGSKRHIHIQRGHKILGVAHLDSVRTPSHFWMNHQYIACPTIDNRLGVWIILHGLAAMGIQTDILLCDDEEKGQSTAQDFVLPEGVQYNWMFSFDRTGTDVACYQYMGKELEDALKPYDLVASRGAYSDIASLEHLGCRGMNFGCGMYNYHTDDAYASVEELTLQMLRFANFYDDHHGVHFPYTKPVWKVSKWSRKPAEYTKYEGYCKGDLYSTEREELYLYHDKAQAERIYKTLQEQGDHSTYFEHMNPVVWANTYWQDPRQKQPPGNIECHRCYGYFRYGDTLYAQSLRASLCKLCFLEAMEDIELINPDWFDLAVSIPLKKGSEDGTTQQSLYLTDGVDKGNAAHQP